jgi:transcriptional regulator with XRE-family HTH domain
LIYVKGAGGGGHEFRAMPYHPVDVHVGQRIRAQRLLLGISQEKLGEATDLTFQQIQKYEKGSNRVGASRLHQFAEILRVPHQFFFEGLPLNARHATFIVKQDGVWMQKDGTSLGRDHTIEEVLRA